MKIFGHKVQIVCEMSDKKCIRNDFRIDEQKFTLAHVPLIKDNIFE